MILAITRKALLELWREPHSAAVAVALPMLLVVLYTSAFGAADGGLSSMLDVRVINRDRGVDRDGERWNAGDELVARLRAEKLDGKPVMSVRVMRSETRARIALREQKTTTVVVVPADFSRRLAAGRTSPEPRYEVQVTGDPASPSSGFAQAFLQFLVRRYVHEALGLAPGPELTTEFLPRTGTTADLQYAVAGLIPFGVLLLSMCAATALVREAVNGTLSRLRITRAHALHLHTGVTLAHMVLAAVVVLLLFGTALALGFPNNGRLPLAIGIGLLLGLSAVGLGLLSATFAQTDSVAMSLASGVTLVMSMLSGALFPLPRVPVGKLAGHTVDVFDVLPSRHAVEAMRRALVHGEGAGAMSYELVFLTLLSAATLGIGIVAYQRRRMRTR